MTHDGLARAVVCRGARQCAVEELPVPGDLAGGALVKVEAAAVCGSDWEHYTDPRFFERGAVVLGHENVGRIVAIDAAYPASHVAVGDRVIVEEFVPCGNCAACQEGASGRCPATDFRRPGTLRYGRTPIDRGPGLWGGFSELLYVHPRTRMHRVPEGLDPHVAAFANPVANGLRWLGEVAGLRAAQHVLVIGPGAHGLGTALAARALGASLVAVVGLDRDAVRLADAKQLGADVTLRADADDVQRELREATSGHGVDIVVDLTPGSTDTVELAVRVTAPGGRVLLAGHKGRPGPVTVDEVARKELALLGVRGPTSRSIAASVDVLSRYAHRVADLATASCSLDEAERALRLVGREIGPEVSHVVVDPRSRAGHA